MSFGKIKELGYGTVQHTVGYIGDRAILADLLIGTDSLGNLFWEASKGNVPAAAGYITLIALSFASAYVSCDLGKKIQKQLTRSML